MAEPTSTEILLADLIAHKSPAFMIRKCKADEYNDYKSPHVFPIQMLVKNAEAANLREIVKFAKAGKYDGTREEANEWYEKEGKNLI